MCSICKFSSRTQRSKICGEMMIVCMVVGGLTKFKVGFYVKKAENMGEKEREKNVVFRFRRYLCQVAT